MLAARRFQRHTLRAALDRANARKSFDWAAKDRAIIDSCHPRQRDFVLDPGKRIAAIVGRGGGKTTGGRARLIRRMGNTAGARCVYIAQTRDVAEELMWLPLKLTLEKLAIPYECNETKLRLWFPWNGSSLKLVGCDDKKQLGKLRGQPFHEAHLDEVQAIETLLVKELVEKSISPRLGDFDGALCLYSTPTTTKHQGVFYDATRRGSDVARDWADRNRPEFADWIRWSTHRWTLQDGAPYVPALQRLWAAALVEKERHGWSDDHPIWRTEYLGEWAQDNTERIYKYRPHLDDGHPWNQWDPSRDRFGIAELPPGHDWHYVFGADLGHSDPFALEVFAYAPTSKVLYHVYEFEQRKVFARKLAELLIGPELNADKPQGIVGRLGWPSGAVADIAGLGGAFLEELSQVYGIHFEAAEKRSKFDAIELFNGDMVDGRIKILKGSRLEEQLLNLQWSVDDYGRLKEGKKDRNDASDAAIYARRKAFHLFSAEPAAAKPPIGTPERADLDMAERNERDANRYQPKDNFENYLGYGEDDFSWYE